MSALFSTEILQSGKQIPIEISLDSLKEKFQEAFYFVESEENDTVLLASHIKITQEGYILWFDSTHQRSFPIKKAEMLGPMIIITSEKATFYFNPLTYEIYKNLVLPRLFFPPEINSEDDFYKYFLAEKEK